MKYARIGCFAANDHEDYWHDAKSIPHVLGYRLNIEISTLIDMNRKRAIKVFKALGEETRFLIVENLLKKELCACEIPSMIGRTQSNTSMHLAKLLDLEILKARRDGKSILYSIRDEEVKKLMKRFVKNDD